MKRHKQSQDLYIIDCIYYNDDELCYDFLYKTFVFSEIMSRTIM